tara:strand:- start:146 stop:580 length:435 start_codon:yes stop_codon:yes gene_type:complete
MKRLLLPLLAALALPTFAGDLGIADYKYDSKFTRDKDRRIELLQSGGTYALRCGHNTIVRRNEICKIEFKDGKLRVNGSNGITPDQIISFSFTPITEFSIFYRDSEGIINYAQFHWVGVEILYALKIEFLYFMNQGKNLPDNYF